MGKYSQLTNVGVKPYNAFDCIKVFTMLLVVLGHVTRISGSNGSFPHEETRAISLITYGIYAFHMPLFIFVSGCIYGLERKKENTKLYPSL